MVKYLLITAIFLFNIANAELINTYFNNGLMKDKEFVMIDIRTKSEFKNDGRLKNSINIPFFDAKGQYDIQYFLNQLFNKIDGKKKIGLICRSGSRSTMVSKFLSNHYPDLKIINILGGTIFINQFKITKLIK